MSQTPGDDWEIWDFSCQGPWTSEWPPLRFRRRGDTRVELRLDPTDRHANRLGGLHGGFVATFAEQLAGLFLETSDDPVTGVTISLNLDYPSGGRVAPIEGEIELLRETRRMQFVRLVLRQKDDIIVSGSAVLRKIPLA